jgi:hypothetical protein
MLLADAAQAIGNKLYILGGGWSIIMPGAPYVIAIKLDVPYDQAARAHTAQLDLVDTDGHAVTIGPTGELSDEGEPFSVKVGPFSTGIPPMLKAGIPIDLAMAVPIPPIALEPNSRYEWRLSIDDQDDENWRLPFSTAEAPPQVLAA